MEKYGQCNYLDMETQSASDMLRKCVGDQSSEKVAPCKKYNYRMNQDINQMVFDRPQNDNIYSSSDMLQKQGSKLSEPSVSGVEGVEGFQNFNDYRTGELYHGPGESFVPFDQCPVGFEVCPKSGKCVQKCMNCKLNVDNKSQEFNEADPCFPEGVYAGIDNLGNTRCTCGQNGQYCSDSYIQKKMNDIFTADGTMILSDSNVGAIVIGDYTDVMSFAAIED